MFAFGIFIVSIALSLITGIIVAIKNYKKSSNVIYVITSISYIALSTSNYLSSILPDDQKLLCVRFVMFFSVLSMGLTLILINSLNHDYYGYRNVRSLSKRIMIAIIFIIGLIIDLSPAVVYDVVLKNGQIQQIITGNLIYVFVLQMLILSGLIIYILVYNIFFNSRVKEFKLHYIYFI